MGKYLACVGLGLTVLLTGASAALTVYSWRTGAHLVRNVGVSLPPGWYLCLPVPAEGLLPLGAIVEVAPPAFAREPVAAYVPAEVEALHWMKHVRVGTGETVCLVGNDVLVEGNVIAERPLYQRYLLPMVEGCWTLREQEVFVVGKHPQSYDARYTGPWPRSAVEGLCQALWTWEEK